MPVRFPANLEHWPLDRLTPYARNARTHDDDQVAEIAASIVEFGWTTPVLIDDAGNVIAGHGRLLAAQKLGLDSIPVIRAAHLMPAQARAYRLTDNGFRNWAPGMTSCSPASYMRSMERALIFR